MSRFTVTKTIDQINERIRTGKAVVLNAEEMTEAVRRLGKEKAAQEVDVVTTGTFSPMCSSGMLFNTGQPEAPAIKTSHAWLNDVPCYAGIAAVDGYLGATEPREDDPLNKVYPGLFNYGGGHVIEDLVRGKPVHFRATAYGTDCYPRREMARVITLDDLPHAELHNPRNCYQNYNAAVNMGDRLIYTYMGPLKPHMRNMNFATAGRLSPLFNDPYFKTIGFGTRILLAGSTGYVIGAGTQHNPNPQRNERGIPLTPSGTIQVKAPLKGMNPRYLRGVSIIGYGCSLSVGIAIPIPVLNEEIAWYTGVDDCDIQLPVKDYGHDYPNCLPRILQHVTYEELKSGSVEIQGKKADTVPMTSYPISLEIANELKARIQKGTFELTTPVAPIESN